MAIQQVCGFCGRAVKTETRNCLLPSVSTCGGNELPKIVQPPEPKPIPEPKPKECVDGKPEVLGCFNVESECLQVFPCKCMSYEECKQKWEIKIRSEGLSGAIVFTPYTYNYTQVPSMQGRKRIEEHCPWCHPIYTTEHCEYQYPHKKCTG